MIPEAVHHAAMNRLILWTIGMVVVAAVAVFNLVTAWALHIGWLDLPLFFALFAMAVGLFVALVRAGTGERRRIRASAQTALEVVGRAARGARWSALAAAALTVLLFADCSGTVLNGPSVVGGPMDDATNFLKVAVPAVLPLVLVIALTAALATAAQAFASRRQGRLALRAAQAGVWAAVIIAAVAFGTVIFGFFFGFSACDLGTSQGACAAGTGSFTNVFAAVSVALLLPYLALIASALAPRPNPDPGVRWDGSQWLSADGRLAWNGSQWLEVGTARSEPQAQP